MPGIHRANAIDANEFKRFGLHLKLITSDEFHKAIRPRVTGVKRVFLLWSGNASRSREQSMASRLKRVLIARRATRAYAIWTSTPILSHETRNWFFRKWAENDSVSQIDDHDALSVPSGASFSRNRNLTVGRDLHDVGR
jgi:hypothetical protein